MSFENSGNLAKRTCAFHLDLKGLPPTPERLLSLVELLTHCGYNAILVEWEDMFPWTCDIRYRCETHYTPETIGRFVERCQELDMEVIPLVQSIGHLEMALRLEGNEHLREQIDCVDCLNPLAVGASELVRDMIDDVLRLMPTVKRLHLGGDEAWLFASNEATSLHATRNGKDRLYLHHLDPIIDMLSERGIRPILWHDMMIEWSDQSIVSLAKRADLAVWGYHGHPDNSNDRLHHTRNIERFSELGVSLWASGAYKGADGMSLDRATFSRRSENTAAWMDLDTRFHFCGFIATGWSRYSTNRVQTSPIDGNQDVIVLIGKIMSGCGTPTPDEVEHILKSASEWLAFEDCSTLLQKMEECRDVAWKQLQELIEMQSLMSYDLSRYDAWLVGETCEKLSLAIRSLEHLEPEFYRIFNGLIDLVWLKEYFVERAKPLKDQLELCRRYKPESIEESLISYP